MTLSIVWFPIRGWRSRLWTCPRTRICWCLYHSNPSMALIIDMVNFTSPLMLTHTKKQESKDLYHPCPSKQLHSFSQLTGFTGQVCPNSMMTYSLFTGCPRRNANNTLMAIWYHHFPSYARRTPTFCTHIWYFYDSFYQQPYNSHHQERRQAVLHF